MTEKAGFSVTVRTEVDSLAEATLKMMLDQLPEDNSFLLGFWFNRKRNNVIKALSKLAVGEGVMAARLLEGEAKIWRQDALRPETLRLNQESPNWAFLTTGLVYSLMRSHTEEFERDKSLQEGEVDRLVFLRKKWTEMGLPPAMELVATGPVLVSRLTLLHSKLTTK